MTRKNDPSAKQDFLKDGFDLPKIEEKVLAFWDQKDIFGKSLLKNQPKNKKTARKKTFVFYEGPPYANGRPGIHHVLARVVKDVMLRYKTMRGYFVPRKAGWDTHGLPVEMAAEKVLGLKSKREIEKFGVKLFNEKAKEQVWIHKDEWERLTRRIGYWLDLKNAYVTYEPEYIESVWWTLAQIHKKKLLFKGHKVVPWCTRCGTSLSSHELAQGYQEVTDKTAFVKFKLKKGQMISSFVADDSTYILSWTTTPWTLPGNVALAVGEEIPYVLVRTVAPDRASYIVAKALAPKIFADSDFAVMGEFPGRRLVGLEYEPLFDIEAFKGNDAAYRVHAANFVTTTDGTGVVHTAVMYGEDDYALGRKVGLPEHHTVNEEGKFTKDVAGFEGDYVKAKDTEQKIFDYLENRGFLFRSEPYKHEYPHCWRCGTPVLYYARDSWFIGMSKLREELMRRNKTIHWMPEHVKEGRFGEWLREAKDWNLSRERFWGAPLPIWECKNCGHTHVVGSLDELSHLAGGSKNNYWTMRHGEGEGNVLGIMDFGKMGFHLTPKGKKQVAASMKKLQMSLKKQGKKIDMIFSSDVLRAKETAQMASAALGVKVVYDKRLREIDLGSTYEGRPMAEYSDKFPTYEDRYKETVPGVESLQQTRDRMWEFLKDAEAKHSGKNILIVSHGDPIWMLRQSAQGVSPKMSMQLRREGKDFYPETGMLQELPFRTVPRNDAGEVDLHRPFADEITLPCTKCDGTMKRVREVADVWYDSGSMPFAQAHFPFELGGRGKKKGEPKPQDHIDFPADYIAEGIDQTRGWFYTLLAISTALGYPAPYKNVITFGLMNDKLGNKMSKSKGNIVEPFPVIEKFGVDAVRWYFYSGTPFGEPKNFSEDDVAKSFRKTHLIVYNSFVFWKTYASMAKKGNPVTLKSAKNILDRWILVSLATLVDSVTKKLDRYEVREAALEMEGFMDDLSRWYIRRSRRRLQRPENKADFEMASATLGHALLTLVKLLAPFTPFFAEALYGDLGGKELSVHLDNWPVAEKAAIDKKLLVGMEAVRKLAAAGLAKRAEAGLKVRQPLASISIGTRLAKDLQTVLAEEVNVKDVIVNPKLGDAAELDTVITAELKQEGILRDVGRMIQELRQKANFSPKDKIALMIEAPTDIKDAIQKNEATLRSDVGAKMVEYHRSDKFTAEENAKLDGQEIWIGVRKL